MTRRTDIVVTTIFEPAWLAGYLDNLRRHGHEASVTLRIICDRKTPASVYAAAGQARAAGFRIDCPTLDEQADYLRKLGLPEDFIPWNTDNRRNIGFLRAWESGADRLISIDDDNYCRADSDFVGEHQVVGRKASELAGQRLATGEAWFNICALLQGGHRDPIYPRGFPYRARQQASAAALSAGADGVAGRRIAINAGLWLDDPDVDAITRLAQRPRITAADDAGVLLAPETWSPINTQNTALLRAAVPAYYYVRMGYPLQGLKIDRFGDILSGYFVQACAKHLGDLVRVGGPVADHRRTPHNLLKDLYHELAGIALIEDLLPWLQELRLEGSDYPAVYASLADALDAQAERFRGFVWDEGGREFLRETAGCMRVWLATLARMAAA
jgi:hypothetical protein